MKLQKIIEDLALEVKTKTHDLTKEVTGGYASDLLSDVIANTKEGNVWVTIQTHINIVAVAVLKELSGIILVNGKVPDEVTLKKADDEGMPIMVTTLPAFEVVGRLYTLGLRC